jgi:putative addiction module component (TIGR02574 family)
MNQIAKRLADEAEKLPVADRIQMVEHLLASLDKPDPAIDAAWITEGEARLEAYKRGELPARDATDVLAKYLKP